MGMPASLMQNTQLYSLRVSSTNVPRLPGSTSKEMVPLPALELTNSIEPSRMRATMTRLPVLTPGAEKVRRTLLSDPRAWLLAEMSAICVDEEFYRLPVSLVHTLASKYVA